MSSAMRDGSTGMCVCVWVGGGDTIGGLKGGLIRVHNYAWELCCEWVEVARLTAHVDGLEGVHPDRLIQAGKHRDTEA